MSGFQKSSFLGKRVDLRFEGTKYPPESGTDCGHVPLSDASEIAKGTIGTGTRLHQQVVSSCCINTNNIQQPTSTSSLHHHYQPSANSSLSSKSQNITPRGQTILAAPNPNEPNGRDPSTKIRWLETKMQGTYGNIRVQRRRSLSRNALN